MTAPTGFKRMEKLHEVALDKRAEARARAFVNQARQYYGGIAPLDPVAKPLLAYYFVLNLTKAFLTVSDPETTEKSIMPHGLGQAFTEGVNYSFKRERFKVGKSGAFRLLSERTGMKHCWAKDHQLSLHELMPYLADGYSAFADATEEAPKLVPIDAVNVLFGGKEAWLRIEIDRNVLRQRNMGPERILRESRVFGDRFRLVTTHNETASYESVKSFSYGQKRSEILPGLSDLYDSILIACDRSFAGNRCYLVLSARPKLLSHEAVTFAVMHHLSNLVRYRPSDGEKLLGSTRGWLFSSWVDRAAETFLLNMASRMTGEDHVMT